jgi:thiamine-monophosphate kinase
MFENSTRTEIASLGEFGLIDHLTKDNETKQSSTLKSIGDDAAVIKYEANEETLISSDMLIEGVHFDLTYVPLKHLGFKAVTVNVSDIYAMNGTPKQILMNLAISSRFSLEAMEEFYSGVYAACKFYNVDLIGGDTTSSLSGLAISITVIGSANKEEIVYRNGAQEKNLLVVTGDLGGAYMGLQILEREKSVYQADPNMQPDLEGHDYILERQLKPIARKDIRELLKKCGVRPTAMIDVSDGLASETIHLCRQSKLGIQIFEEKIPIDPQTVDRAKEMGLDPSVIALNGGEDYELLMAIDIHDYEKLKDHLHFSIIGHFTGEASGYNMISKTGALVPITAQGWDALLKK